MSGIRKMKRNMVPRKIAIAKTLAKVVEANGGDYKLVKQDFAAAILKAFPGQGTKEVYAPAGTEAV